MTEAELQRLVQWVSSTYFENNGVTKTKTIFRHRAGWNLRLRTTGGRYLPSSGNLEFNPKQLAVNGMEELVKVIKHELVHYHLHQQGLPFGHGSPYFKDMLARVGGTRFCQPTGELSRNRKKYHYVCAGCGQTYQRQRRVNTRKYVCGVRGCGGRLTLTGFEERNKDKA